jgi:hypothetical protein
VQSLRLDGTWESFPETTLTGPTSQIIRVPTGQFRIVINAGAAITVEINW